MGKWTRRAFITTGVLAGGAVVIGVAIRPGNRAGKVTRRADFLLSRESETIRCFDIWRSYDFH